MPDNAERSKERREVRVLMAAGRWLLSIALAFGALTFLVHGRSTFARFGRPDGARIALASAEFVGAGLFLFRRRSAAGAIILLVVLAWAAGFHFALGLGAANLWLYLVAVLVLHVAAGPAQPKCIT